MTTIYFDLETTGLNPHNDSIALFQYRIDDGPVEMIPNPDPKEVIKFLSNADLVVAHNCPFDFSFLKWTPANFDDTLYLDRIVNFREEYHSLDLVAERVFGSDVYAGYDKKAMQKSNWANPDLTPEQLRYAAIDVEILPTIHRTLKAQLGGRKAVYDFDIKSIRAGIEIAKHGLPVLRDKVEDEIVAVNTECERLLALLHPLNPNSPKQVTAALGVESSGDRVLADLEASGNQQAKLVRLARGQLKYLNFLRKLIRDDRYYGTLQPAARSGRFTSSKENIQNLPRDTKKFIGSKTNVIVAADFAQLELRTIASITNDETMRDLFINGADLHDYSAEQLFGKDFTKQDRQIAKVFNFSTLYGAGPRTISLILLTQTGIKLPEHKVKSLKQKWLSTFEGIALWQRQGSTRHEMGTPHQTPHGRRYTSKQFTDHLSIENQGAGAEVARIALHYILENLPSEAKLVNFIHDSYIVEAPNDPSVYEAAAKVMYDGMKRAWAIAPFEKHGIPMPVDVGVAHNVKDADALENCLYVYSGE